jgi:hypothetical protein
MGGPVEPDRHDHGLDSRFYMAPSRIADAIVEPPECFVAAFADMRRDAAAGELVVEFQPHERAGGVAGRRQVETAGTAPPG